MTPRIMSDGELTRLEVLRDLDEGRLTVAAAAGLLALERRQVFRLLKAFQPEGAPGLISKRRNRPSNRRKPETVRYAALAHVRIAAEQIALGGQRSGSASAEATRPLAALPFPQRHFELAHSVPSQGCVDSQTSPVGRNPAVWAALLGECWGLMLRS